jgi:hypothetical protein
MIRRAALLLLLIGVGSCSASAPAETPDHDRTVRIEQTGEIQVYGTDGPEVMDISAVALDPDDSTRIAVVDRTRERVVLIDLTRQAIISSTDDRVQRPMDVAFKDGLLLISVITPSVVHVADRTTLRVSRSIPLVQTLFAGRVHPTAAGFLTESTDTHYPAAALFEYSLEGELIRRWHGFSEDDVAPFWGGFFWEHAAVHGDEVFVASAMRHVLFRYDQADEPTTFGGPPDEFRAPRRPERSEFSAFGESRAAYEEFARSFTMISSIWTTDRHLIVEHQDLDPEETGFRLPRYSLDVYDLETLDRLDSRLTVGGPVLAVRGRDLLVLTTKPPSGPWVLSTFRVVPEGSR